MHPNPINIFNHWVILIYLFFSPLARAMIFSTEIYDYSTKIFFFKLTPSVEMNNVAGMHIRFLFWNESQLAGGLVQSYRVITFSCPCDTAIHKTHNTKRQTQKHKYKYTQILLCYYVLMSVQYSNSLSQSNFDNLDNLDLESRQSIEKYIADCGSYSSRMLNIANIMLHHILLSP